MVSSLAYHLLEVTTALHQPLIAATSGGGGDPFGGLKARLALVVGSLLGITLMIGGLLMTAQHRKKSVSQQANHAASAGIGIFVVLAGVGITAVLGLFSEFLNFFTG